MRAGRASTTAALVALARALASAHPELGAICRDPFAATMVDSTWLAPLARAAARSDATAQRLKLAGLGLVDHLALRTALIDEATREIAEEVSQLVVLGAGFDTRAHRLSHLAPCRVFEVDRPDTQRLKQTAASGLPLLARDLRYVACDFQTTSLPEALAHAGHSTADPTLWIWEGVTMYLSGEALNASIADVSTMSAPGSHMIVTYVTPQLTVQGQWLGRWGGAALGLLSEPLRSRMTPGTLASRFAHHGWRPVRDELPARAAARYGVRLGPHARALPAEHVLVLHKA